VHGLDRTHVREGDRVLIIGEGRIGLGTGAALRSRGIRCDIMARHDHQKAAADKLGAGFNHDGHYDVVIDAVGSSTSLQQSVQMIKPMERIGLVGVSLETLVLEQEF